MFKNWPIVCTANDTNENEINNVHRWTAATPARTHRNYFMDISRYAFDVFDSIEQRALVELPAPELGLLDGPPGFQIARGPRVQHFRRAQRRIGYLCDAFGPAIFWAKGLTRDNVTGRTVGETLLT